MQIHDLCQEVEWRMDQEHKPREPGRGCWLSGFIEVEESAPERRSGRAQEPHALVEEPHVHQQPRLLAGVW